MGYRCPVCSDPQSDETHLANHLAFTAMLGDDDHEAWLDDRVEEWASLSPPDLAERVTPHVDETDFPQVFEDTTDEQGRGSDHAHDHSNEGDHGDDTPHPHPTVDESGDLDQRTRDVLEEARELTRRRRSDGDDSESE
jgi:hypothetical protein